ncbi:MAG: LysR family transcriptional regulator [Bacteroidales bacterium]|nr:LysR family transcriptional regulator [Bacteroidales bacterium]
MNNNDLRYFYVLATTLHFGRAAQLLHITQPPLTRTIKRLEEELGVLLFKRSQRKVVLTKAGEYLKKKGEALLSGFAEIEKEIKKIDNGKIGQLHITSVGSVVPVILRYVNKFLFKYPDVNIKLSQYTTSEQIELIKSGKADIAFVRCPLSSEGLELQKVFDESYVLIMPKSFNRKIEVAEDLQQLSNMPYISFPREFGRGLFDRIISLCQMGGFSPDVKHESYQLDTAVRMVEAGMGITIVPRSAMNGILAEVNVYELDFMPQRSVVSFYYSEKQDNPVMFNFVRDIANKNK